MSHSLKLHNKSHQLLFNSKKFKIISLTSLIMGLSSKWCNREDNYSKKTAVLFQIILFSNLIKCNNKFHSRYLNRYLNKCLSFISNNNISSLNFNSLIISRIINLNILSPSIHSTIINLNPIFKM
jgi:hypothetical protein